MENSWKIEERKHFYYDNGKIKHCVFFAHSLSTSIGSFIVDVVAVMYCDWLCLTHSYPFSSLVPLSCADIAIQGKSKSTQRFQKSNDHSS